MKGERLVNQIIMITLMVLFIVPVALCDQTAWDCPECRRKGNTGNYCGGCAQPSPWLEEGSHYIREKLNSYGMELPTTEEELNVVLEMLPELRGYITVSTESPKALTHEAFQTVGNIVKYGHYEQDNDLNNGPEEIEWIVLDVKDGKSLLLSRYLLDEKPYNISRISTTWERCTLRAWLNGIFLKTAFSEEEKAAILITDVDNSDSQKYSEYKTFGGKNTQDKIFLLSYREAFEEYIQDAESRRCEPTDYAIAHGGEIDRTKLKDGRATGSWWLRSPGGTQQTAAGVYVDGSRYFNYVEKDYVCVRPAFWINLESEIF